VLLLWRAALSRSFSYLTQLDSIRYSVGPSWIWQPEDETPI
jgi:hypothetical protein